MTGRPASVSRVARSAYFRTSRVRLGGASMNGLLEERGGERARSIGFPAAGERLHRFGQVRGRLGEERGKRVLRLFDVPGDECADLLLCVALATDEGIVQPHRRAERPDGIVGLGYVELTYPRR